MFPFLSPLADTLSLITFVSSVVLVLWVLLIQWWSDKYTGTRLVSFPLFIPIAIGNYLFEWKKYFGLEDPFYDDQTRKQVLDAIPRLFGSITFLFLQFTLLVVTISLWKNVYYIPPDVRRIAFLVWFLTFLCPLTVFYYFFYHPLKQLDGRTWLQKIVASPDVVRQSLFPIGFGVLILGCLFISDLRTSYSYQGLLSRKTTPSALQSSSIQE